MSVKVKDTDTTGKDSGVSMPVAPLGHLHGWCVGFQRDHLFVYCPRDTLWYCNVFLGCFFRY